MSLPPSRPQAIGSLEKELAALQRRLRMDWQ
jgi:hypothetical protein